MTKLQKRVLIAVASVLTVVVLAVVAVYALLKYSVLPVEDGQQLADGAVTTVVAGHFGPVAIAAHLIKLNEGFALIDSGSDPKGIREALLRYKRTPEEIRAIFLTHGHADHAGGVRAFPEAAIYILAADAHMVRRAQSLEDGAIVNVSGTPFEVFAVSGHTPGSAAFLVHGVLFVGDSAAAAHNSTFQANIMMGDDPQQTVRSLRALAQRLGSRRAEIRAIAFGHQGALNGVQPLLSWANQ